MKTSIYLDHAATTPLRPEVRVAMERYVSGGTGNPSSVHAYGRRARASLDEARARIATALGARPAEIVFVRGGTEGDNLAVVGRIRSALRGEGPSPSAVVTAIEHRAVLDAARASDAEGSRHVVLAVARDGSVDADRLDSELAQRPAVVSAMWVNNETGLLLPIEDIAERTRAQGVAFHTDAVQAIGKVPVRVDDVPVDLLTLTGHKIGGPTGIGVLFVRRGVRLEPLLYGGGQERGLRPGTEDVAGAVGLATAVELAVDELTDLGERLTGLRQRLEDGLLQAAPGSIIHGSDGRRAPHVANIGVSGVASSLVPALDLEGVAVSGGSACASGAAGGSHVIEALYGIDHPLTPVRFSLGHGSQEADVQGALDAFRAVVTRARGGGPATLERSPAEA